MALFDFVSGENFRLSLEADYRELDLTMKAGAWKAVHVLAGSIIETLLVDHLVASGYQKRTSKDPLKMRLEDIIAACKTEKALSEKTEQFSHVIRSYRNLIHPGRVVRLSETVDENGATIAHALVNIVIKEL